jgi:hypothetical protein
MGRLPDTFAQRKITMRIPYSMEGELVMMGSQSGVQFPDATYTNNVDMPFEGHRMIPRVAGLDSSGNVQPTQLSDEVLGQLVRLRINDFGKNVVMLKNPALIDTLTKGTSERTWEWADPYYLVRSEGFQVISDTLVLPVWDGNQIPVVPPANPLAQLRIAIVFQGFLLQVAPPSNSR